MRREVEYETDDTLPTCCLCLNWFLDKLCCREVEEDTVYTPSKEELKLNRPGEKKQ